MKKYFLLACGLILATMHAAAQKAGVPRLFTGTIDGKIGITLYLQEEEHHCEPRMLYSAIYKYDKVPGNDSWLWLDVDYNEANQFIMTEERFSGVMILRKEKDGFSGIWIHPDGVTQRKVVLKQKQVSKEVLEKHAEYFEETNHRYHDC
ncbi:hypothetical protein EGT74_04420 [Chitinophaga lutea]|uniref:Uncharacterized protein n=1 Tax=Chitinophaga lutea TaxID=2488634 RepID=A0A3N4PZG4_9BACT|nr:hypothetical protein [Chitinophaga lutea]RPE12795.1 hypothetical protein EGT74_04420 [Chitinophaga lutea]